MNSIPNSRVLAHAVRAIVCFAAIALAGVSARAQDDFGVQSQPNPAAQPTGELPLPLARRAIVEKPGEPRDVHDSQRLDRGVQPARWAGFADHPWLPMAGSLAVVLVVFFALMALLRRGLPAQGGKLPPSVFEVLGQATLAGKQQLHLVRCGHKLLLTCTTTTGTHTLTEISEPGEVEQLTALCRGAGARTSQISARKAPAEYGAEYGAEFGNEPAQHSFVRGLYRESSSV
jgi:flagellar biogenesis protein FliO